MTTPNTAQALKAIYGHWGCDPRHPVSDWQHEVSEDETRLGYWDWLENKLENDADEEASDER